MNEWGIPDWRNEDGIEGTSTWGLDRWKWEFLRRREDLRNEFEAKKKSRFHDKKKLYAICPEAYPNGPLAPEQPGFSVVTNLIDGRQNCLPNPKIGAQPYWAIRWEAPERSVKQHFGEEPPDGYFRVDFDLSVPLALQLSEAKLLLLDLQKDQFGSILQKRRHPKKWKTYLRVLDARSDGASWRRISSFLENTAKYEQTARDCHRQAVELCFNF